MKLPHNYSRHNNLTIQKVQKKWPREDLITTASVNIAVSAAPLIYTVCGPIHVSTAYRFYLSLDNLCIMRDCISLHCSLSVLRQNIQTVMLWDNPEGIIRSAQQNQRRKPSAEAQRTTVFVFLLYNTEAVSAVVLSDTLEQAKIIYHMLFIYLYLLHHENKEGRKSSAENIWFQQNFEPFNTHPMRPQTQRYCCPPTCHRPTPPPPPHTHTRTTTTTHPQLSPPYLYSFPTVSLQSGFPTGAEWSCFCCGWQLTSNHVCSGFFSFAGSRLSDCCF